MEGGSAGAEYKGGHPSEGSSLVGLGIDPPIRLVDILFELAGNKSALTLSHF